MTHEHELLCLDNRGAKLFCKVTGEQLSMERALKADQETRQRRNEAHAAKVWGEFTTLMMSNPSSKYDFKPKLGTWSIIITQHGDVAETLYPLMLPANAPWIGHKRIGQKLLIYRVDKMLDSKWRTIMRRPITSREEKR
jgi:hypothetical protein